MLINSVLIILYSIYLDLFSFIAGNELFKIINDCKLNVLM